MMNNFAPTTSSFSLSRNYGLDDNVLARVVTITTDRANVTGFGRRAIVANPGCKILIPDKEGNFEFSRGCERGDLSLLHLRLLESKGVPIIEYRTAAFYIDLPVTIDHGYNYSARCKDKISYTAQCLVSIRNEAAFLSNFSLSHSKPAITVQMVENALARGTISLLGNDVDDMGHILPRKLYALFQALGLFLHGRPSISNYENSRVKRLSELREEYERDVRESLKQLTQAEENIALKVMETLPQLMASLAASQDPAEIDRTIANYKNLVKDCSKAVQESHAKALESKRTHLSEAERRANYQENKRPDRVYRQAASLPQGHYNQLSSGEGHNGNRYHSGNYQRRYGGQPQGYEQRGSYKGGNRGLDRSMVPYQGEHSQYARNDYQRSRNDHNRNDRSNPRPYNKYGPKYD